MTFFDNVTIKYRMILSFVVILAIFVAFGIVSIRQMTILSRMTQELYDHPLQVSNASLKAKSGIISMHRSMKDVSTATTQTDISLAIKQVQDEEKEVYQELALIQNRILGQEGQHLVEETMALFARWKPIRSQVQGLVLQGDREAANQITREQGADYVARLERKVTELTAYALNKAAGFMANAQEAKSQTLTHVLVFSVTMIALALFIGYLISSSILSSINQLQKVMTEMTKTGVLEEATLTGNNEISLMSDHFNGLIRRLKEQFWLNEGENLLNQTLSGNQPYDAILTQSIDLVCHHIDACAGALYAFNAQTQTCKLKASYALAEGKQFSGTFSMGQGIVGQAAKEQKPILLENISTQEARISSGIMNAAPLAIFAVPIFYEKHVFGVLEVAAFETIPAIKQDFLLSAGNIISVFLNAAAQNRQIQALLTAAQHTNEKLLIQTEELKSQTEELQAVNEEFQQQSDELKDQNIELEQQRLQVEEANRLKSEFLSNMSHELRTPLNSVNALSRVLILQAGEKLSDDERNYLEIIERNGKHLLSLINDILDLSKIEAGKMDVHISCFSVKTLIENIMNSIAPLAADKKIGFTYETSQNLPKIESDESRVHQILQNIVANAVKFTDKGRVTVSAEQSDTHILIRVNDTGIGISSQDIETIFEEFRQADGATTRKFEGTGLGLAIAYKAAKLLGGNIRVSSTVGKGTEFTIMLPIHYSGPAREIKPYPKKVSIPDTAGADQNKTILIVDDDPKMQEAISDAFSKEGFDTLTADSGKEALTLARQHKPFAITLDVIMPGMDGWEVLSLLKKDPDTAGIPVIVISVSDDADTGYALGAVGYISKPVKREALVKAISKIYGFLPSTVMVVDDDDLERTRTAQIITAEGMKALLADGGKRCLDILETARPDVLVLDLVMPGMDGFELLETIRATPDTADLPVIVVTAKDLSPTEKKRLQDHVSSILIKDGSSADRLMTDIKRILHSMGKKGMILDEKAMVKENTVLVVEDNEAAVIQVKKVLETLGVGVDVASDGQQALDYIQHTIPQGIILDLMMANIDGFQVLESVRGTVLTRNLPVLILTARDLTRQDLERLSANNIQQLVQKGDVDREELLAAVSRMLGLPMPDEAPPSPSRRMPSLQTDGYLSRPGPHPAPQREDGLPMILVVEDNPDNMTTIKAVLKGGQVIEEAADGQQGLDMAIRLIPDLILLDMGLPKMDGMAVVRTLKQHEATRHIPVIAMTAQTMKGDREKILNAGCDDYVAKPIDPEAMIKKINDWLTESGKEIT